MPEKVKRERMEFKIPAHARPARTHKQNQTYLGRQSSQKHHLTLKESEETHQQGGIASRTPREGTNCRTKCELRAQAANLGWFQSKDIEKFQSTRERLSHCDHPCPAGIQYRPRREETGRVRVLRHLRQRTQMPPWPPLSE